MIRPHICTGPDCPICGCRDVRIVREPQPPRHASFGPMLLHGQPVTTETMPASWASGSWGSGSGVAVCRHCERSFSFTATVAPPPPEPDHVEFQRPEPIVHQDPPPVEYQRPALNVVRCPECGEVAGQYGKGPKVKSKQKKARYYKCSCGCTFKVQITG
jgi:hypothetical protein